MPYRRSQQIEKRLEDVLSLIRSGHHSTPSIAKVLDVSQPTASRCIDALRERGYEIRSVRDRSGWRYELVAIPAKKG